MYWKWFWFRVFPIWAGEEGGGSREAQGGEGVSSSLLAGAGGTNTDSWGVSFAPRLELVASRRVAQHSAGDRVDPSAMARPAHRCPLLPPQRTSWYPELTLPRPHILSTIPCDSVYTVQNQKYWFMYGYEMVTVTIMVSAIGEENVIQVASVSCYVHWGTKQMSIFFSHFCVLEHLSMKTDSCIFFHCV